jgi:hypothetical protein
MFISWHNPFNMGSKKTTPSNIPLRFSLVQNHAERTLGQSDKLKIKTVKLVLVLRSEDK